MLSNAKMALPKKIASSEPSQATALVLISQVPEVLAVVGAAAVVMAGTVVGLPVVELAVVVDVGSRRGRTRAVRLVAFGTVVLNSVVDRLAEVIVMVVLLVKWAVGAAVTL